MEDTEQMQRITEEKKVAVHEELIRKATAKKVCCIDPIFCYVHACA